MGSNTCFLPDQKKLREVACEELAKMQNNTQRLNPVFAEVRLPEKPASLAAGGDLLNGVCIEAVGIRITAGGDYPAEKLAALLRSVTQPC